MTEATKPLGRVCRDWSWMAFVQGKTIAECCEEDGWFGLRFTDGTQFHFASEDGFVLVEAQRQ